MWYQSVYRNNTKWEQTLITERQTHFSQTSGGRSKATVTVGTLNSSNQKQARGWHLLYTCWRGSLCWWKHVRIQRCTYPNLFHWLQFILFISVASLYRIPFFLRPIHIDSILRNFPVMNNSTVYSWKRKRIKLLTKHQVTATFLCQAERNQNIKCINV